MKEFEQAKIENHDKCRALGEIYLLASKLAREKIKEVNEGSNIRNLNALVTEIYNLLKSDPKFSSNKKLQNKDLFVSDLVQIMVKDIAFEECLYPDSVEALKNWQESGPVWLWSQGDAFGTDIKNQLDLKPSQEQPNKLVRTGLNILRKNKQAKFALNISASEDKEKYLPEIVESLKNVSRVLAIISFEDQGDNLSKIKADVEKAGLENYGFLITGWKGELPEGVARNPRIPNGFSSEQEYLEKNNLQAVASITDPEVTEILKKFKPGEVGFICDVDDVLLSDAKRFDLTIEALTKYLNE